ncbi:hypothetical protein AVEN_45399-1 [Araneus ventricosus]|uniref:DUF5641 domain-containing protein n=1 Tax=Araneus ventricosus TaxID=182803 RepID=A0A4Y2VHN6_ARAVE|nr:hypothetical protein AVEN_238979-1 [Araneus ventricosus]GBO24131.1 hypothetical protein AVEN_45399-1 [Araneus ventricosus]
MKPPDNKLALQGGVALVVTANLWQTRFASEGGDSALLVCQKFASSLALQICHDKRLRWPSGKISASGTPESSVDLPGEGLLYVKSYVGAKRGEVRKCEEGDPAQVPSLSSDRGSK